ncbi:ATP-dependent DNA helicase [Paenibacillus filicis]|uniref:ATP-dependent DNA helicase n=1 Tax=Paenibacillus gyeongsangnamensis TaxID=3388067 RepID=A0ABT4QBR0_9BACL|nr:ATP-dependent DNA helicase [Paenibacillus filicis]MCZ8514221.1 ATP-dependent DNA helicase [Paenibacillus filicis]
MEEAIRISVRTLVEYVYRCGSIESGFHRASTLTDGTEAHQKLQKTYKDTDQKEVYLQTEAELDGLRYIIEGRCDGLLRTNEGDVLIDEIKSTSRDLAELTEDAHPVHWAQARCYAYMAAERQGLKRIQVQLTYVRVGTDELRQFRRTETAEGLATFMMELLKAYAPFASLKRRLEEARNESIRQLPFPFDSYREGQRKLAGAVYKTITDGKSLFAKAPTGIGKTVSTIFPAVKAIGEGRLQRIFYVTAKTIARTAAEATFRLLEEKGLRLRTVAITAKEKICFKEEMRCSKEHCEYADGFYDRINAAILDLLAHETTITRQVIEPYARKHRVCPFEFALEAAYAADAVICDYNYVYDPRVSLKRLFEEQRKQTALLVDEAHNLPDRAREMYSAELRKSDFLALQREFKDVRKPLSQAARLVNDYFIGLRKRLDGEKSVTAKELPHELADLLGPFAAEAELALLSGPAEASGSLLLDTYFAAQAFLRTAKLYDERYVTYAERERGDVRLKLFCLDPSQQLRQMSKGYRAKIFFSATLSPLPYYQDVLGGSDDDYAVSVPSPFSRDQLEVRIQPLSTRFKDREATREPLAALLRKLVQERQGNYLIFFPSFEYMNSVLESIDLGTLNAEVLVQQPGMTEEERERFLAAFQESNGETLAGFTVMGGLFSEGIDLVGDRLTGVAVVGVGLPQIGPERDLIKNHFDESGKDGFDYAYVYPGMNKVLQAGGRLIRSETDRGVLMLVDDRFLQPKYRQLLPYEWRHYEVVRFR